MVWVLVFFSPAVDTNLTCLEEQLHCSTRCIASAETGSGPVPVPTQGPPLRTPEVEGCREGDQGPCVAVSGIALIPVSLSPKFYLTPINLRYRARWLERCGGIFGS